MKIEKLGCPVSEFVRKSAREPSREARRTDFRTIGQFGSARLSVGQAKNFRPRLGRRSDRGRNFVHPCCRACVSVFNLDKLPSRMKLKK